MIGNIDIRAVVLATLAVFGIDFITGIVLFSIFTSDQITNASDEQVRAAAVALARDPGYLRAALILGTASTAVGGFLVARIARSIPYFNALAYGGTRHGAQHAHDGRVADLVQSRRNRLDRSGFAARRLLRQATIVEVTGA